MSLTTILAAPADAFVGCADPETTLCSPTGMALEAELEAQGVGAAATTATMVSATAVTDSTISGVTIANGVAATGSAAAAVAVLQVSGWAPWDLVIGHTGVSGLNLGGQPDTGWVNGNSFPVTAFPGGAAAATGTATVSVTHAPPYNDANGAIQVIWTMPGSGWWSGAQGIVSDAFPKAYMYVNPIPGLDWFSSGWPSSGTYDGVVGGGGLWHYEVDGSDGVSHKWYPSGHPLRPAAVPAGQGTVSEHVHCVGANGAAQDIAVPTPANLVADSIAHLPEARCPAGMVAASGSADFTPSVGGTTQNVIPTTTAPASVTSIPTDYPDCLTAVCHLDLQKKGTPDTSCGNLAIGCPDWYLDPSRENDYVCSWGPYEIELSYCSVFRDPGHARPNAQLGPDGTTVLTPWPPLELDSDVVQRESLRLSDRYSSPHDCEVLGEFIRSDAPDASIPDTVLVCESLGIAGGLTFAAQASADGLSRVVHALVGATTEPEPLELNPYCDLLADDGSCLDGTVVQPSPAPAPAAAGGALPPNSCLNDVARGKLLDSMPVQEHHVATNKSQVWTSQFQNILEEVNAANPNAAPLTLGDAWNILPVKHRGPHPAEYHQWVRDNMEQALEDSGGDRATFIALFTQYVADVVENDPTIVRVAYWKCYRVRK